ncbi:hypothetical protein ACWEPL_39945 [Nonomuraea sp. NPDC004186]
MSGAALVLGQDLSQVRLLPLVVEDVADEGERAGELEERFAALARELDRSAPELVAAERADLGLRLQEVLTGAAPAREAGAKRRLWRLQQDAYIPWTET